MTHRHGNLGVPDVEIFAGALIVEWMNVTFEWVANAQVYQAH